MTRDDITARLLGVFRETFGDGTLEIHDETVADDIPGWDSLMHINLIFAVEQEFAIKFSIKDARALRNVADLVDTIARKAA